MRIVYLLSFLFLIDAHSFSQQIDKKDFSPKDSDKTIVIKLVGFEKDIRDSLELRLLPLYTPGINNKWKSEKVIAENGTAQWYYLTDSAFRLNLTFLTGEYSYWLVEPGDNIRIENKAGKISFSGRGAEKYRLQYELMNERNNLIKPTNERDYYSESIMDYLEWNQFLDMKTDLLFGTVSRYKDILSTFALNYIMDEVITGIIDNRSDKFYSLWALSIREGKISKGTLCQIYDSTYHAKLWKWVQPFSDGYFHGPKITFLPIVRKDSFNTDPEKFLEKRIKQQQLSVKVYSGLTREKFWVDFLTDAMIDDYGFIPETETLLARYYSEPGYPAYKEYVREYEKAKRILRAGKPAPDFKLEDVNGKEFTKEMIKGKVALIDFWFTGCIGCIQMTPAIHKIEKAFSNDSNVVFLSISIDKDRSKWLKSSREGKYTTGKGINLYTGGMGDEHSMMKTYSVSSYPSLYLLDAEGKVVQNPLPDPRTDDGKELIKLIHEQLVRSKDGPYVLHNGKINVAYYVNGNTVSTEEFTRDRSETLSVQTDEYGKYFSVNLKEKITNEMSEFEQPEKLFAVSDIEGNFGALRKLLQRNNVIDENYNWTFGNGHLVFTGDMFDRGYQVTECLWLIYMLEEKAKKAGGYVHFILGNHEIMNLNGDIRYQRSKYQDNAGKIGKSFNDLYNSDSELGKWLRSKNIMEKIGDILFVHGGISTEVNELPLTIQQINNMARPFYDREMEARKSGENALAVIYNTSEGLSPFWYRNYYLNKEVKIKISRSRGMDTTYKATLMQVNSTLDKFNVAHIVTGHTIVKMNGEAGEHVTTHYDSRIINIDTHHALGRSEALMIERDRYYRVNENGERFLLFDKDEPSVTHAGEL